MKETTFFIMALIIVAIFLAWLVKTTPSKELKAINAELLEALKQIVEYENQFNLYFDKSAGNDADMRAIAREAIAKAKSND